MDCPSPLEQGQYAAHNNGRTNAGVQAVSSPVCAFLPRWPCILREASRLGEAWNIGKGDGQAVIDGVTDHLALDFGAQSPTVVAGIGDVSLIVPSTVCQLCPGTSGPPGPPRLLAVADP